MADTSYCRICGTNTEKNEIENPNGKIIKAFLCDHCKEDATFCAACSILVHENGDGYFLPRLEDMTGINFKEVPKIFNQSGKHDQNVLVVLCNLHKGVVYDENWVEKIREMRNPTNVRDTLLLEAIYNGVSRNEAGDIVEPDASDSILVKMGLI